jgi:hypothetical protein
MPRTVVLLCGLFRFFLKAVVIFNFLLHNRAVFIKAPEFAIFFSFAGVAPPARVIQ